MIAIGHCSGSRSPRAAASRMPAAIEPAGSVDDATCCAYADIASRSSPAATTRSLSGPETVEGRRGPVEQAVPALGRPAQQVRHPAWPGAPRRGRSPRRSGRGRRVGRRARWRGPSASGRSSASALGVSGRPMTVRSRRCCSPSLIRVVPRPPSLMKSFSPTPCPEQNVVRMLEHGPHLGVARDDVDVVRREPHDRAQIAKVAVVLVRVGERLVGVEVDVVGGDHASSPHSAFASRSRSASTSAAERPRPLAPVELLQFRRDRREHTLTVGGRAHEHAATIRSGWAAAPPAPPSPTGRSIAWCPTRGSTTRRPRRRPAHRPRGRPRGRASTARRTAGA